MITNSLAIQPAAMRFTAKAVLGQYIKSDGTQAVEIRATIDRKQVYVPLGFCMKGDDFDASRGQAKPKAPNAELINFQIAEAVARANKIFLDHKFAGQYLTVDEFRREFIDPASVTNFLDFYERELKLRKAKLEPATYGSHNTILEKLKKFKKRITFSELTVEFCQRFERELIDTYKIKQNTIHKIFRTIKVYVHEAERKNIQFKNPFDNFKVKQVPPAKAALSFEEMSRLFDYFRKESTPGNHKKVLRYFLFSCTTGLRISDITRIHTNNLHGDTLIFVPHKTRKRNRDVVIPLTPLQRSLLDHKPGQALLFDCYAEPVTNRLLKEIAAAEDCKIKKILTYHISRHTFATLFLDNGGNLDTLQQILGHSMITTTMQYVRVRDERKHEEMEKAFNKIKI